jgi:hypothetical protein
MAIKRTKTKRLLAEELVTLGANPTDAEELANDIGLARAIIYQFTKEYVRGRLKYRVSYFLKLVEVALMGDFRPTREGSCLRFSPLTRKEFAQVLADLNRQSDVNSANEEDWDDELVSGERHGEFD